MTVAQLMDELKKCEPTLDVRFEATGRDLLRVRIESHSPRRVFLDDRPNVAVDWKVRKAAESKERGHY